MALSGAIVLAVGGFFLWNYLEQTKRAQKRASVTISVKYDTAKCDPKYPLFIAIRNGSVDILEKVTFDIEGRRVGYSDPVIESNLSRPCGRIDSGNGLRIHADRFV